MEGEDKEVFYKLNKTCQPSTWESLGSNTLHRYFYMSSNR